MKITLCIGIISGLVQLLGYVLYIKETLKDKIKPNGASWIAWSYGNALLTWSYIGSVEEIEKKFLPFVCSIMCIITTIIFIYFGKFKKLSLFEVTILLIDILVTLLWIFGSSSASDINTMVDATAFISFIPIVRSVYVDSTEEKPLPWFIWTFAYLLLLLVSCIEYSPEKWTELIYPGMYALLHAVIGTFSLNPQKSK